MTRKPLGNVQNQVGIRSPSRSSSIQSGKKKHQQNSGGGGGAKDAPPPSANNDEEAATAATGDYGPQKSRVRGRRKSSIPTLSQPPAAARTSVRSMQRARLRQQQQQQQQRERALSPDSNSITTSNTGATSTIGSTTSTLTRSTNGAQLAPPFEAVDLPVRASAEQVDADGFPIAPATAAATEKESPKDEGDGFRVISTSPNRSSPKKKSSSSSRRKKKFEVIGAPSRDAASDVGSVQSDDDRSEASDSVLSTTSSTFKSAKTLSSTLSTIQDLRERRHQARSRRLRRERIKKERMGRRNSKGGDGGMTTDCSDVGSDVESVQSLDEVGGGGGGGGVGPLFEDRNKVLVGDAGSSVSRERGRVTTDAVTVPRGARGDYQIAKGKEDAVDPPSESNAQPPAQQTAQSSAEDVVSKFFMDKIVQELTISNKKYKAEAFESKARYKNAELQLKQFQHELDDLRTFRDLEGNTNANREAEREELVTQLQEKDKAIENLMEALSTTKKALDASKNESQSQIQTPVSGNRGKKKSSPSEDDPTDHKTYTKLLDELSKAEDRITAVEKNASRLEKENGDLTAQNLELRSQNLDLLVKKTDETSEPTDQNILSKLVKENEDLKAEKASLEATVEMCEIATSSHFQDAQRVRQLEKELNRYKANSNGDELEIVLSDEQTDSDLINKYEAMLEQVRKEHEDELFMLRSRLRQQEEGADSGSIQRVMSGDTTEGEEIQRLKEELAKTKEALDTSIEETENNAAAELRGLQKKLATAEAMYRKSLSDRQWTEEEADRKYRESMRDWKKKEARLEKQIDGMKAQLDRAHHELTEYRPELERLQREAYQGKTTIADLKLRHSQDLRARDEETANRLRNKQMNLEMESNQESELAELQHGIIERMKSELSLERDRHDTEIDQLQQRIHEMESKLAEAESHAKERSLEATQMEEKLAEGTGSIEKAEKTYRNEIRSLQRELQCANQYLETKQVELSEKASIICSLQDDAAEKMMKIRNLEDDVREQARIIQEKGADDQAKDETIRDLQKLLEVKTDSTEKLLATVKHLEAKLQEAVSLSLDGDLQTGFESSMSQKAVIEELQKSLDEKTKAHEEAQKSVKKLRRELQLATETIHARGVTITGLEAVLHEKKQLTDDLQATVERLEEELEEKTALHEELIESMEGLEVRLNTAESALAEASNNAELQALLDEKTKEFDALQSSSRKLMAERRKATESAKSQQVMNTRLRKMLDEKTKLQEELRMSVELLEKEMEQVADSEADTAELQRSLDEKTKTENELRSTVETLEAELEQALQSSKSSAAVNSDLQMLLHEKTYKLQESVERLERELQKSVQSSMSFKATNEELRGLLDERTNAQEKLQKLVEELKLELQREVEESSEKDVRNAELEATVQRYNTESSNAEGEAMQRVRFLEAKFVSIEAVYAETTRQLEAAVEAKDAFQQKLERREKELRKREKELSAAQDRIKTMSDDGTSSHVSNGSDTLASVGSRGRRSFSSRGRLGSESQSNTGSSISGVSGVSGSSRREIERDALRRYAQSRYL